MQPNVAPHVLWDHAATVNLLFQNLLLEAGTSPRRQSLFLNLDLFTGAATEGGGGSVPETAREAPTGFEQQRVHAPPEP